jgi:hypothetical protein
MLEDYFVSIGPFINTPLIAFKISIHPCLGFSAWLSTKYQNETNILSNISNFVACF